MERMTWEELDEWCAKEAAGMSIKDAIACVDKGNAQLEVAQANLEEVLIKRGIRRQEND